MIDPKDIKTETYRSAANGGMSINLNERSVRMTHLPTGISVEVDEFRLHHQNREKALKDLNIAVQDHHEKQMERFCEDNMGKEVLFRAYHDEPEYATGVIQEGHRGPLIRYTEGKDKGLYDWYYRLIDIKLKEQL